MQHILSTHLWRTIKAQASKSRCRKVAVAYVTKDLIGFRKGDTLVTDASESVISSSGTNAKLLSTLHRRGVALYSYPGLHAKVLLLDDVAVIGSGNMSESSHSTLVEAALMTDSPHAVSGVDSLIHQLIKQSSSLDKTAITKLCKIKVVHHGRKAGDKPILNGPKIRQLGNQTWLVGVYVDDEEDSAKNRWTEHKQKVLSEKHETDVDSVDWGKSGRFIDEAKPGDQLIQICRPTRKAKQPKYVLKAVTLLDKYQLNGVTHAFVGENKGPKSEITWAAFKMMMKQLKANPGGINSERILRPDLAEAINNRWKTT